MNLEKMRVILVIATFCCCLLVTAPVLSLIVPNTSGSEKFSELWLLGEDHMAEKLPFNVSAGNKYDIFLGVSNHMDISEYYKICVKFAPDVENVPGIDSNDFRSLPCKYQYRFFIDADATWESKIAFGVEGVKKQNDGLLVSDFTIDDVNCSVDVESMWNSEKSGYFFILIFELWHYDLEVEDFRFDDVSVQLYLNVTTSIV